MTDTPRCPKCQSPLPADAAASDCPRCLLAAGLGSGEGSPQGPSTAPTPEEMGKHFPLFEILELLGQGGMGIVYKARQRSLDRVVALKVLPPDASREAGFADRFSREARTLARLQHPNIVGVHDFGVSDGLYYLVMEHVDGANLREAIRSGKLSAREALAIVPQICDALQYAHDQGVVHRDIKPENILLDRAGRVRIADFGLAKIVQRTPLEMTLTRAGQVMGTLHYMAPEQYKTPDSVDHRADIYSLGVVFYEMLTGELPIGSFPPPSDKAGVDVRLDGVVLRALERERERRWQNASDVKTQVSAISSSGSGGAPPTTPAAGPAPAAASAPPPPPAVPAAPRLSRLAVAGGLGVPASIALGALAYGITGLFTMGSTEDFLCPMVGTIVGSVVMLVGFVISVAAWVQIKHSAGRLTGIGWAVTGAILAPVFLCCGGPATFLTTPGVRVHEGPDGRTVRIPFIHVDETGGKTRVRMPFIDVTTGEKGNRVEPTVTDPADAASVAADACLVHGGPEPKTAKGLASVARDVRSLWAREGPRFVGQDRELTFVKGTVRIGGNASDWRLYAVALSDDGGSARAVFTTDAAALSVDLKKDGESWTLVEGDWEWRTIAAGKDDEDGRLFR